jgi:BioD-like phosphotransacetylase family protein
VLIPSGFTREYLDGAIEKNTLLDKIHASYQHLRKKNDFLVIEGTGHCGVGSIIHLNNAQVASELQLPILLVASGGLGSAFDQLMLNKTLCDAYGVPILGVILNRVLPEKMEMIKHYMTKALKRWDIPLVGTIPFDPFLSFPTMKDFEGLFDTSLITAEEHRLRHFNEIRLVATSVETYRELIVPNQLIITPANREDIILATLTKHWDVKIRDPLNDLKTGMILTGDFPPRHYIIEELQKARIPMLHIKEHSHTAMQMISSFTAKIRTEDIEKVKEAITVVERHVDFDLLDALLRK